MPDYPVRPEDEEREDDERPVMGRAYADDQGDDWQSIFSGAAKDPRPSKDGMVPVATSGDSPNPYRARTVLHANPAAFDSPSEVPAMGRAYAGRQPWDEKLPDEMQPMPSWAGMGRVLAGDDETLRTGEEGNPGPLPQPLEKPAVNPAMGNAYREPMGPPAPEDSPGMPAPMARSDAARSLGEFAAATGTTVKPPQTNLEKFQQGNPLPSAPSMSPDYAATQADLRAKSAVTPKYDPQTGKVLDKYKIGAGARIGRAFLDAAKGFLYGGIGGAVAAPLEGAFGNRNAPGYYGRGAVNNQYFKDENQRQQAVAGDTGKIKSFEDENNRARDEFKDKSAVWKDAFEIAKNEDSEDIRQQGANIRQQGADTRARQEQTGENKVDPNSVEKNADSPTGFYGYALGDKDRKNPIAVTPRAAQKPEQQPKSYEQQVLAWAQESDPQKKAELEKSITHIEQQRRSMHQLRNKATVPDVQGLSAAQNRSFKAQLTAEAIPQRRAALQKSLSTVAPKDRKQIQDSLDKLDQRSQQILSDIRKGQAGTPGKPTYLRFSNDGKGNRLGYNPKSKQWEKVQENQ